MKIARIRLQNYRCFDLLERDLAPGMTVLVAPNGGGKTALLDGIASALGGFGESLGVRLFASLQHSDVRRSFIEHAGGSVVSTVHYPARVELELAFQDGTQATTFRSLDEGKEWNQRPTEKSPVRQWFAQRIAENRQDRREITWPCMAYYRVGRARLGDGQSVLPDEHAAPQAALDADMAELKRQGTDPNAFPQRKDGWNYALDATADWKSVRRWWALEYLDALAIGREVSSLCRVVEEAVGQTLATSWRPQWSPADRDILVWAAEQGPRPVGLLSDGYRTSVALFADLARRCALLNPHLGAQAAALTPGIVLVDEVELHLHPAWQRRFLTDLRTAFPKMQIIVTTHSPQVLAGITHWIASPADELLFFDMAEGRQPTPVALEKPQGFRADQILTGPWFRLLTSLDTESLELIEQHRKLVKKKRLSKKEAARRTELEVILRDRLGRFYDTYMDEVVHRVVTAILKDNLAPTWDDLNQAGDRALALLKKQ